MQETLQSARQRMRDVDIRPVGDAAVLAVLGDEIDPDLLRDVWSLTTRLRGFTGTGILDVVPAYASVLVRFDPLRTDLPRVMSAVRGAAEAMRPSAPGTVRHYSIGAVFGGTHGVDMERAAHELGMREARLLELFCKPVYQVAFLGFVAGYPYLVGLPPALRLPRLATPRPRVPAGSVAVALGQCGIYPRATPGGWRLLGRTMAPLFDHTREQPALLSPGDLISFVRCQRFESTASVDMRIVT